MTTTRYMTDLLETTNEHVEKYLADLEEAARKGVNRAYIINWSFDMLTFDMDMRFMQTVGLVKALASIAHTEPLKVRFAALLGRTLDDLDFMAARCSDRVLRSGGKGNDHNTICHDIAGRFDASLRLWADLARDVSALADNSPLALAGPAIVTQIMLDFDMLSEQFRDFVHDGTTGISEDGSEVEESELIALSLSA